MKKLLLLLMVITLTACNTATPTTNTSSAPEVPPPISETEITENQPLYDDVLDGKAVQDGAFVEGLSTIRFPSKDGLMLTADLYLVDQEAPFLLLFHRAEWSRGEYIHTAEKFNALGYNCLAVDQRSGKTINDIENRTALRAKAEGKATLYKHAIDDVRATIEYVAENFDGPIYLLGSSYSASLILVVGQEYYEDVKGIMAFSPGENLALDQQVVDYCAKLNIPTFLTSGSHESYEPDLFYQAIATDHKFLFTPYRLMKHGSEILWDEVENNQEVWEALLEFIRYTESL